ncbi:helix-turn-helix transcriptional regulator [Verminephrobacter eiseniae]|uniref:helix-turn-helix transcriptional regulator n=1 Tax=Verminephrobacter eiseniae TaxID=364317 RepID=UPI002239004F|nr:hypothetical protein [Verminephrobacter eiseniae]
MMNPLHLGEWLREDVPTSLCWSFKKTAERLGVACVVRVLNGHATISPYLGLRLELTGAKCRHGPLLAWHAGP